jgi:beta-glucosidase
VTGTEVLHGVARVGPATAYPQAVGLASTWNPDLVAAGDVQPGESGDGVVIRHIATGEYLAVDAAGRCHVHAATPRDATPFVVERLVSGVEQAAAPARGADVAIVVLGNHPLINCWETEDRVDLALPAAQANIVRSASNCGPTS